MPTPLCPEIDKQIIERQERIDRAVAFYEALLAALKQSEKSGFNLPDEMRPVRFTG